MNRVANWIRAALAMVVAVARNTPHPAMIAAGTGVAVSVIVGTQTYGCVPIAPAGGRPGVGGAPSTGGSASAGGNHATGGSAATGGASATTGTTQPSPVAVRFPACNETAKAPSPAELQRYRAMLKPRHHGHEKRVRAPIAAADPSWGNVFWASNLPISLDQLSLGSCTGNAAAACVSTQPFTLKLTETDAVSIYSLATKLDRFSGSYPPTDTGSDGASACKALVQLGFAKSCTNFSGYTDALGRLQKQPIIVGMNWYASMFSTNACGALTVSGALEGGHEIEIVGYDAGNKRVWLQNSWGNTFGVCLDGHCGYFYLTVNDLASSKLDAEFDAPDYTGAQTEAN